MTATDRAMAREEWDRIRELEASVAAWKQAAESMQPYEDEVLDLRAENERLREALRAEAVRQGFELPPATDEQQAPGPFEVVKVINGTWNVRDASTGDWVPDGVWLSKPDATALAERLSGASRDSQQTETES